MKNNKENTGNFIFEQGSSYNPKKAIDSNPFDDGVSTSDGSIGKETEKAESLSASCYKLESGNKDEGSNYEHTDLVSDSKNEAVSMVSKSINEDKSKNKDEGVWTKNPFHFFQKTDIWLLVPAIIFNALSAATNAASTVMISKIFSKVTKFYEGYYISPSEFMHEIEWPCFGLILIGLGVTIFGWLETTLFTYLGEKQQVRCRKKLYESLLARDLSWFEANSHLDGDLVQLNRSVEEFRSAISEYFSVLCKALFSIISLLIISFFYSWKLTLLIMAVFPIIFLSVVIFGSKIDQFAKEEDDCSANALSLLSWNFSSFLWVKIIYSKDLELKKFAKTLDDCEIAFRKFSIYANIVSSIMQIISLMLFVQSFWFGSYLVKHHKNSSSNIIAAFYSCLKLAMLINSLSMIAVIFQKANTSFKKVVRFLLPDGDIKKFKERKLIPDTSIDGDIEFNNVSFKYEDNKSNRKQNIEDSRQEVAQNFVLNDISLRIKENETTYIIGKSGSGKSTIASLLLKLYSPTNGSIYIDGHNLTEIDSCWLRNQVTLIQQFPAIFNDSIKNNILLGTPYNDIDDKDIISAIDFFNMTGTIDDLPQKFETKLGKSSVEDDYGKLENGSSKIVQFSGGQEQRLNLIKAKLRNSNILVLDESMSALDIKQRENFMAKINSWRKGKTTVIITHELTHIRKEDNIYFLENGKIVENGTKEELLHQEDSKFFNLHHCGKSSIVEADEVLGSKKSLLENKRRSMFTEIGDLEAQESILDNYFEGINGALLEDNELNHNKEYQRSRPLKHIRGPIFIAFKVMVNCLTGKEKFIYCIGIALVIGESVLSPVFSFCFSNLITGIIPDADGKFLSTNEQIKWSVVATSIAIATGLVSFFSNVILCYISESLCKTLQNLSLQKILNQKVQFFENIDSNEISTLLINDIRDFRNIFKRTLSRLFSGIAIASLCIIWTLTIGWKYSLVCFSLFPLFIIFSSISTTIMQKYEFKYKESVIRTESIVDQTRSNIKTIMCLNVQDYFKSTFDESADLILKQGFNRSIAMGFSLNAVFFVVNLSQSIMFYYGFKLVASEEYTLVEILRIIMMILMSVSFITELLTSAPGLYRGLRVAIKLHKLIFETEDEFKDQSGYLTPEFNKETNKIDNFIEFDNITFEYPSAPNLKVLQNFSMKIPSQKIISVVGESGCGKSTLFSLLLRLYSIEDEINNSKQTIKIEGYDTKSIKLSHLMNTFAVVTQKHYFFNGTIRENLLYGNPIRHSINEEKIMEILKLLDLDTFVQDLKHGLDSLLCKSGNLLVSGGQAQRLSIARAWLRNSKIMLLDECTASLDNHNSKLVLDALKRLRDQGTTVICITHQEVVMKTSDLIFIIDNGTVKEFGSFDDLLTKKDLLYQMIM